MGGAGAEPGLSKILKHFLFFFKLAKYDKDLIKCRIKIKLNVIK